MLQFFNNRSVSGFLLPDALQRPQIDQDVDQGILIGNRTAVPQDGTFNPKRFGLAIDALLDGAQLVYFFVGRSFPIQLMADASSNGGRQGSDAFPAQASKLPPGLKPGLSGLPLRLVPQHHDPRGEFFPADELQVEGFR